MRKQNFGFTLIELAIAVLIIAVLAAIAVPRFANLASKASRSAVLTAIGTAQTSIAVYRAENRGFPTTDELAAQMQLRLASAEGVSIGVSIEIDSTNYIINTYTDSACTAATSDSTDKVKCAQGTTPEPPSED